MIDPNAPGRPGKMNFAKMLNYVRQNPMALMDGSMKRPMQRPGMPPTQPMMMARAGGYDPMGPQEPGVNYGGAPTANPPGTGPTHGGTTYGPADGPPNGYSAPTPDLPDRPGITPIGQYGVFDPFGPAPTATGYAVGGIARPGMFSYDPVAPAKSPIGQTAIARAMSVGMNVNRGTGGAVNAAGQAMGGPAPGSDPFGYGGFANEGYGTHGYGVNPQTAAHEAAASAQGNYGSSSGAGAAGTDTGSKVVCTAMCRAYGFGSYRQTIWLRHYAQHSPEYQRGYHAIFVPLLRLSEGHATGWRGWLWRAMQHMARHTTADIELQRKGRRRDRLGQVYRTILEPTCFAVGWLMNAGR